MAARETPSGPREEESRKDLSIETRIIPRSTPLRLMRRELEMLGGSTCRYFFGFGAKRSHWLRPCP
jgi:hypothetical protein